MDIMDQPRKIYVPPGGPPTAESRPHQQIYSKMGEENIFLMLRDFYRELEKSDLRSMFPDDMAQASEKTAAFFVFILGGPPLYQERHGSPMMRHRHLPFVIDEHARQIWLMCFHKILEEADSKYNFPMEHMPSFIHFLDVFSAWMVNSQDTPKLKKNNADFE
jgi:hemoglobin